MPAVFTHQFDTATFKGTARVNTGLFINGQFVDSADGATFDVYDPFVGKVVTKVAAAGPKDVDAAVSAAKHAFKTTWGLKTPGHERGRLLGKLADLIAQNLDELAALEALDGGKPYSHAKTMDLPGVIACVRYYAGWADKNYGRTIETSEAKFAYTRHEPIGVAGLIIPWNFPLLIASWKFAPALATGNTVIIKPSEVTPLTVLRLAELVTEAGFPAGVFNVLPGLGSVAGQAITEHPDIGKVSFTGSTLIGRKIMETAAKTNLKRVTLELGGKNPTIIFDDADLEQAIKWAAGGIFMHSGQVCASGSRIFIQEGIYDQFVEIFKGAAASFKLGHGFDPTVNQGPLVSQAQLERVLGYIESGKKEGAKLQAGGVKALDAGYFVEPTVFTDVHPGMKIVREEIFGPVAVLIKFKTEDEVIALANDTVYGLSSNIFSQNITRALRVAHAIEAGSAYINQSAIPDFQVSFGGVKQSGFGKDMGEYALENYTQVKAVHVNLGVNL